MNQKNKIIRYSISCFLIIGFSSCGREVVDETKFLTNASVTRQKNDAFMTNDSVSVKFSIDDTLHNPFRKPKKIIEYEFKFNNDDLYSFGFRKEQQGPSIGVNQILINNDNLYLIDSYHSSIKKIAIFTRQVTTSLPLNNIKGSLNSLAYFNDRVSVFSNESRFYTLDENLKEIKIVEIPDYKRGKDVFNQANDTIFLFRPTFDFKQKKDYSVIVDLLKISKDYSFSKDSVLFDSFESFRQFINFSVRGKKYSLKQLGENSRLMFSGSIYLLGKELPSTSKWYDTKNIDIQKEKIAFFEIDSEKIKITILLFK